jgi:putative membrane protein
MTSMLIDRHTAPDHARGLLRVAIIALIAHAALSLFSAFAFATFLSPPAPAWLNTPTNARALAFGFTWGGQSTVMLGAIAGWCFLAWAIGVVRASWVFVVSFCLSLASELAGTSTGFPFGAYGYTTRLGYLIGGLVPFNIPTSWFYMLVASLAICGRLLAAKDDNASKWWWSFVAAFVLTAWDVSMDPAMVKTAHWLWRLPDLSTAHPIAQFVGSDFFFGMPITNWLGWLLTGILVSRAMLQLVPPSVWARAVSPHNFPLVLYAVNGLLPIAICFRQDMVLAGVLGTIAMALPLLLAVRAKSSRDDARVPSSPAPVLTSGNAGGAFASQHD